MHWDLNCLASTVTDLFANVLPLQSTNQPHPLICLKTTQQNCTQKLELCIFTHNPIIYISPWDVASEPYSSLWKAEGNLSTYITSPKVGWVHTSLLFPHPTLSLNATLQRLCLHEVSIETSQKLECAKISGPPKAGNWWYHLEGRGEWFLKDRSNGMYVLLNIQVTDD